MTKNRLHLQFTLTSNKIVVCFTTQRNITALTHELLENVDKAVSNTGEGYLHSLSSLLGTPVHLLIYVESGILNNIHKKSIVA